MFCWSSDFSFALMGFHYHMGMFTNSSMGILASIAIFCPLFTLYAIQPWYQVAVFSNGWHFQQLGESL